MKNFLRLPLSKASSETGLITEAHWDRGGERPMVKGLIEFYLSEKNQDLNLTFYPDLGLTANKTFKRGRKGYGKHLSPISTNSEGRALRSFDSVSPKADEAC